MKNSTPKSSSSIQVVDRLVHLLEALSRHDGPASLKALADETGLHPSTAFRILGSLIEHGVVERSESGQYQLGVKLLQLGSKVRGQLDIRREAIPIIDWLRDELDETVNLISREGDEIVYMEHAVPHRMMRVEQGLGSHAPLHVTALGKLFLAEDGAEACLEYAERTGLKQKTPHSITDPATLWHAIKDIPRKGYSMDDEEAEIGVGCIGVPVRDSTGQIIAGISVSAPMERRQQSWVQLIKQAGEKLSARLGYAGAG